MKTKSLLSFIILLNLTILASASDKNSNYSGDWKLDREKTNLGNAQLFMVKISLKLKNDSLFTTRVYENSNGEQYPFDENLTLDGKEHKITIYDMPRKAKAYWSVDESLNIETTTTFYGNSGEVNVETKEIWKVDANGSQLIVDFTTKMQQEETKGTYYFKK